MKSAPFVLALMVVLSPAQPSLEILAREQSEQIGVILTLPGRQFFIAAINEAAPLQVRNTPHRRSKPKAVPVFKKNSGETK